MHSMGIHSALAIKRQRKRRNEARIAKERRHSTHSADSSFKNSNGSLDKQPHKKRPSLYTEGQTVKSIGMLHIGVVFLVLGTFLLVSGLMPDDLTDWSTIFAKGWFNELVLSGSFTLLIGVFLVVLNKIIAKQEDEDLSEYVARQLTRTKSGQRLVRDVETGCMTTKHDRRLKQEDGREEEEQPTGAKAVEMTHIMDKGTHLELIVEEECSEKGEEESRCLSKESCGDSNSPSSPSETQELLAQAERYFNMAKK